MTVRTPAVPRFTDRRDAGRALVGALEPYRARPNAIVLALPRGGVPVGYEVARALGVPLDVFIVRKIGVPWEPELAMGAAASGGTTVLDEPLIVWEGVPRADVERAIENARREIARHEEIFRGGRAAAHIEGKTVILVDDGLATGSTMRAAVEAVRRAHAARIVVAVPVCPRETAELIDEVADEVVCLHSPPGFTSVGACYEDFAATSDDEVVTLLNDISSAPARPGDEEC
jgi:putative phosphoribosyl transferase